MARLDIDGLAKRYGDAYAVREVSLSVADGEFVVLLGPSGCGKTTTLRMVAGFIEPTAGRVSLAGTDITLLPPWKRNAGMVFQSYALFPHLTVAQNIAFGLEMRKLPRVEVDRRGAGGAPPGRALGARVRRTPQRPRRLGAAARAIAGRAGADQRARQPPARYGGIRLVSRRADRHSCPSVAVRPPGRADRQSRRRLRAGSRPIRSCR